MEQVTHNMWISRRRDAAVFCHSMNDEDLKAHFERPAVPGDCTVCEWFGHLYGPAVRLKIHGTKENL